MKTSTIIRFLAEVVVATFLCLSLFFHAWEGLAGFVALAWLLWMGKPWVRQPISPRYERWLIFCFIAPLAIFAVITIFFPSFSISDIAAKIPDYRVLFFLLWVVWIWQIFRQWRRAKGKADA
jgi:hypothetical protein